MKPGFLRWILAAGVILYLSGIASPAEAKDPAGKEGSAVPTVDEIKIWFRHEELMRKGHEDPPMWSEKFSEEQMRKKMEAWEARQRKRDDELWTTLIKEFPGVRLTDIPIIVNKVYEFRYKIMHQFGSMMDKELGRLRKANALTLKTEKLAERQILMDLSDEYPSLGEELLQKLVIEPAPEPPPEGAPSPAPESQKQ